VRNFIYLTQQFAACTCCIIWAAVHFRITHADAVAVALATVAAFAAVATVAVAIVRVNP